MRNVVLIGATSGIAEALAKKFAKAQFNLILAGRDINKIQYLSKDLNIRYGINSTAFFFDALDYDSHSQFFEESLDHFKEIHGVVLCYGYLGNQQFSQINFEESKMIIETNYTSYVSVINIFAEYFENQKNGFICALSSVAGDRGRKSNYTYGSAKGALSLYLQGMRNRLSKKNVNVITVKPGFVDTKMTYGNSGMFLVAKPDKVAEDIYKALHKSHVIYTPCFWYFIMKIIKSIPEFMFKRMNL